MTAAGENSVVVLVPRTEILVEMDRWKEITSTISWQLVHLSTDYLPSQDV
jgi:hypothetical protein